MAGELVPVTTQTPLTLVQPAHAPIMTVDSAFEHYTTLLLFVKTVLHKDVDYGIIPGTDKGPTGGKQVLLLPGAEKLSTFFGLGVEVVIFEHTLDWTGAEHNGEPFFYFNARSTLTRKDGTKYVCEASANSWEEKWRSRAVPLDQVVALGLDPAKLAKKGGTVFEFQFAIDKRETTGQYGKPVEYWDRWLQAIKDGTAKAMKRKSRKGNELDGWEMDDTLYLVPNARIYDQVNTVQAIAAKRAFVRGVNYAVGASQFFTTDMEKMYGGEEAGFEEGEGGQSDLGAIAETLDEAKKRLILDLTRGVAGGEIWFTNQQAIKAALDDMGLTFNRIEDYQAVKKALIEYAEAHR